MTALYLYDDRIARGFEPFALTRPCGELRAGIMLIRERWEQAFGVRAAGFIGAPHLKDFEETDAPAAATGVVPAGSVVVNSRCVPPLGWRASVGRTGGAWQCSGKVAALHVASEMPISRVEEAATWLPMSPDSVVDVAGRWVDAPWSVIASLTDQLRDDIAVAGPLLDCQHRDDIVRFGEHAVYLEQGATIEPYVVLDATAGPILVRRGAAVRAFTRVVGPCFIDAGATILGDRVSGCSIGAGSHIRGEISESIVLGQANKGHEGFVGHSYLGRWVNLGASTVTSNLKNTYGTVTMWTPDGMRDTGLIKLGTLFGDHVKTGIGLRLTTGSVIAAGSNIYGSTMPPKYVPPFSWGEGEQLTDYRLDKFMQTTERAMSRRGVTLGARARAQLAAAHARRAELGA
ncbi:MAG: hypothetical protein M3081_02870 [Gemmatimonadota bacterium]|nr:hypothetical protein [Gemmatimonadota bacterium]